jgi:hypothetical protein
VYKWWNSLCILLQPPTTSSSLVPDILLWFITYWTLT